jgi:hypothetical protein
MALVALTNSDDKTVRIDTADVVAIEELSDVATRVHLGSGKTFVVRGDHATVESTLGL